MRANRLSALLLFTAGCQIAPASAAAPLHEVGSAISDTSVAVEQPELHPLGSLALPEPADDVIEPEVGSLVPAVAPREPKATRIARQQVTVYAAPRRSSPVRGRIPMARAFDVFAFVDGPGCDGLGWADVGEGGFACLTNTRKAGKRRPNPEPAMRGHDGLTPFYYAKKLADRPAPRWSSLAALRRGDPPAAHLQPGHDYAFRSRRFVGGEIVLVDTRGRVVKERDVHRFRPSRFEGRNLALDPVPSGKRLAWAVSWPETSAHASADPDSPVTREIGYHDVLLVEPKPVRNDAGTWMRLGDGSLIAAGDIRVWSPIATRPRDVGEAEVWLDVDLQQQTLAVNVGDTPVFVTLISSGYKNPTPRGVFRINNKQAVGTMSSSEGASDFYNVEAVPFVQYFAGGFALHGAYWHDYFGKPISHGCINLSPKDSQHVFSLTAPRLLGGWLHAFETEEHPGTVVRIRRGEAEVTDKRGPVEPVYGR